MKNYISKCLFWIISGLSILIYLLPIETIVHFSSSNPNSYMDTLSIYLYEDLGLFFLCLIFSINWFLYISKAKFISEIYQVRLLKVFAFIILIGGVLQIIFTCFDCRTSIGSYLLLLFFPFLIGYFRFMKSSA